MTRFTAVRFVDTNVLLYAISNNRREAPKTTIANEVLEAEDLALSSQVLQEFYVQATRASRTDRLAHEGVMEFMESLVRYPLLRTTRGLVFAAVESCRHFRVSYWDAAIIEAARTLGCDVVLSEDLSHSQDYDGVRVENPFLSL